MRRALLIGIEYKGTADQLDGCINDALALQSFLLGRGFQKKEIMLLHDNRKKLYAPTRWAILRQLRRLIRICNLNKDKECRLFISYSGHGSYVRDLDGDEEDGCDEVICPVDYKKSGFITDDYLKKNFIDKLHKNVTVFLLFDCCHSGTICDLKYNYACDRMRSTTVYEKLADTECRVVLISGCLDKEYSYTAFIEGKYRGTMTSCFIKNWRLNKSYYTLINQMRIWLRNNNFPQTPQLSSGHHIDVESRVSL